MKAYNKNEQPAFLNHPLLQDLAGRRMIIPAAFALVILLFFFSFCNFGIAGEAGGLGGGSQQGKSISGFHFITGTQLPTGAAFNNDFVSGFLGIGKEQARRLSHVSFNLWALLALGAAVAGVYVFRKEGAKESRYGMLAGIAGGVSLLIFQLSVRKYEGTINMGFITLRTEMSLQFAYWLSLLAFIVAGGLSYLRLRREKEATMETDVENEPVTPIHVRVITREREAEQ